MRFKHIVSGTAVGALMLATSLPALGGQSSTQAAPAKPAAAAPQGHDGHKHAEAFNPDAARRMTVDELKNHLSMNHPVYILDVRAATGGKVIKGAYHVPTSQVAEWAKDKAKDALIVTYCT